MGRSVKGVQSSKEPRGIVDKFLVVSRTRVWYNSQKKNSPSFTIASGWNRTLVTEVSAAIKATGTDGTDVSWDDKVTSKAEQHP